MRPVDQAQVLAREPMPSISIRTWVPDRRKSPCLWPTPARVPVLITSPGSRVVCRDEQETSAAPGGYLTRGVCDAEEAQPDVDRPLGQADGARRDVPVRVPLVERAVAEGMGVEGGHVVVARGLEHQLGELQRDDSRPAAPVPASAWGSSSS